MAVTILLAVVAILVTAFIGLISWAIVRLVRQLDRVCARAEKNTALIEQIEYRLNEHEKWHSYRQRASDRNRGQQ